MRRMLPIAALAAVLLAAAASAAGASAAPGPPRPALAGAARSLLGRQASPFASLPLERTAELRFAPATVSVDDVDYTMRVDVIAFVSPYGGPPFTYIDVALWRGPSTAEQLHDYFLTPNNPITFTVARRTLAHASFDSGAELLPDAFAGDFTASAAQTRSRCTLTNGRTGYRRSTRGTVSWSQFSLDTGTSPFFGTLVNGPADARLIWDPGCSRGGRRARTRVPACGLRSSLVAQGASGTTAFAIERTFAGTHTLQLAATGTDPSAVKSAVHLAVAVGPGADLPPASHSPSGATAHFLTSGAPFLTGSATFTSSRAPRVSSVRRCRAHGRIHRFRVLGYRGTLAPDGTPLTAPFDTGDLVLVPTPARLVVRRYLS